MDAAQAVGKVPVDVNLLKTYLSSRGVTRHVAQAVGKVPVDVNALKVDLMSISAHKLYGPKGIGALYVRRRPRVRLEPVFSGGGQERGLRSGTLPHPLVAGFGAACDLAAREMERDTAYIGRLSRRLADGIQNNIPHTVINGSMEHRYVGNLNISFAYVEGESLLMALKDIAISSGSACTSASLEPSYVRRPCCCAMRRPCCCAVRRPCCCALIRASPLLLCPCTRCALSTCHLGRPHATLTVHVSPVHVSQVLRALGVDEEMAHTSIRFGIGRFTTEAEVH